MSFKKVAAWTTGIIAGLVLLLFVVGFVVIRSSRFHQYLLSRVEQAAGEADEEGETEAFDFFAAEPDEDDGGDDGGGVGIPDGAGGVFVGVAHGHAEA